MEGWISLHRKMVTWEWYNDPNTLRLFLHCLLKANHTDKKWRGIDIERGSFVTSYGKLSKELELSVQNIRTSIANLKLTGELTSKSTSKNTVIKVVNYGLHQTANKQTNKQVTSNQQATNIQLTTDKNDKNNKNVNNEKNHHQAEKNDDDDLISLIDIEKLKKEYKGIDVLKELQEIEKKISGQKISVPENYVRQCLNNMLQKRKIAAASSDDYRHFDDSDYMSGIPTGIKVVTF